MHAMLSIEPYFVRFISWVLLTEKIGTKPRSKAKTPINGSVVGTMNHFVRDMFWHVMKLEIQEWMDSKAL